MIRELSSGPPTGLDQAVAELRLNILRSLAPAIIRIELKIIQASIVIRHRASFERLFKRYAAIRRVEIKDVNGIYAQLCQAFVQCRFDVDLFVHSREYTPYLRRDRKAALFPSGLPCPCFLLSADVSSGGVDL
jgi:hypothetical protein